jgi:hypothetical protein
MVDFRDFWAQADLCKSFKISLGMDKLWFILRPNYGLSDIYLFRERMLHP